MSKQIKKYKIFINYYIQNDKWESISNPNLFILPESYVNLNDVKAKAVYDNFPLQNHFTFYLRFFLDDKTQGVKGWVDFPPNATIPVYNNGNVYVKALRLPKGININFKNNDVFAKKTHENKNKENLIFLNENNNSNPNAKNNEVKKENSKENFVIPDTINFGKIGETLQDNNSNQNLNNEQKDSIPNQNVKHSKTLDPNLQNTFTPTSPSKKKENNNNMQNPHYNVSQSPNLNNLNMNNNNFINNSNNNQFKSPTPTSNTPQNFANNDWGDIFNKMNNMNLNNNMNSNNNMNNNNNMNRNNMNNNNNMNNSPQNNQSQNQPKIDSTLEGVFSSTDNNNNMNAQNQQPVHDFTGSNLFEIDKIPDNLDEDEIKNRVNIVINKWSMGVNEKKNLLFLITTLHEVWTHSNLETPPMQKLVNDKTAVRTYYKKAMRELHADKNRDKDFKTRYIAETLYQILNEANAAFL